MAKKRKLSKRVRQQPYRKGRTLHLRKPAPLPGQYARLGVAFASVIASLTLVLGCIVVQTVYFLRDAFGNTARSLPTSFYFVDGVVNMALVTFFLKSPYFLQPKLGRERIELIDFSYVMRLQRRQFFFAVGLVTLNILPVLYLNGTLDTLSQLALRLGSNPRLAKILGWVGTVALSGIIGNLTTYAVVRGARFVVARLNRKDN